MSVVIIVQKVPSTSKHILPHAKASYSHHHQTRISPSRDDRCLSPQRSPGTHARTKMPRH